MSSSTALPASPEDAKLLPLVVGGEAFAKRSAMLPPGVVMPSAPPPGFESDELKLVLVFSEHASPVLSVHLQAWGTTFESAMRLAMANLHQVARADVAFELHPTGARCSQWQDGFDATRALLLPEAVFLAQRSEAETEAEGPGDVVVMLASNNKVYAARSKNPLAMCLMGDLALDVQDAWVAASGGSGGSGDAGGAGAGAGAGAEVVSMTPWRLVAAQGRGGGKAGGGTRTVPRWARFCPNAKAGEYSVPRTRAEVEAVLEGAPKGRIPVFDSAPEPAATDAEASALRQAASLKQQGNEALKGKELSVAAARYSAACDLLDKLSLSDQASDEVLQAKAVLLSNRSLVRLHMSKQSAVVSEEEKVLLLERALADAQAATVLRPSYPKARHREGVALRELGRDAEAEKSLELAKQLQAKEKASSKKRVQKQKKVQKKEAAEEQKQKPAPFLLQEGASLGTGKSKSSSALHTQCENAKHGSNKDGTDVIIKDVDLSSLSLGMPIGLGPMSTSQPHRNSLFNMNELS